VMFEAEPDAGERARQVVSFLNEHDESLTHARHIHVDEAKSCGLKIEDMEENQELQDLILTTHHCFMHTFANTPAVKIIENQMGNSVISVDQPR